MNAEAIAENKPAWLASVQQKFSSTHEDEGCAKILVILLEGSLVELLSNFAVVLVESRLAVLLNGWRVLIPVARQHW